MGQTDIKNSKWSGRRPPSKKYSKKNKCKNTRRKKNLHQKQSIKIHNSEAGKLSTYLEVGGIMSETNIGFRENSLSEKNNFINFPRKFQGSEGSLSQSNELFYDSDSVYSEETIDVNERLIDNYEDYDEENDDHEYADEILEGSNKFKKKRKKIGL